MFQPERYGILNKLERCVNINSPEWRPAEGLGERLKEAFGTESVQEIANQLKMSYQGVDHLIKRRRKFSDSLLLQISALTNCSIDWLLTAKGPKTIGAADVSMKRRQRRRLSEKDRQMAESLISVLKDSLGEGR